MRHLLAALALVMTASASAQIPPMTVSMFVPSPVGVVLSVGQWIWRESRQFYYIEVAGFGPDADTARNNGFRLAVEQALGSLISSETEAQNGRIQRDEIISYASGYVDRFEIVTTQDTAQGVRVTMRVWVARSSLSDRLLNRSEKSGEVNGSRASVQLETLNQERATGDQLLATVLRDFPRRAFDIEMKPTDVVRNNRTAQLEVPFRLTWNQDYLRSFWTAVEATSHRRATVSSITVNSGNLFGFGGIGRYDDTVKYQMALARLIGSEPSLLVTVKSSENTVLYSRCYYLQELDHQPSYHVTETRFVQTSWQRPSLYLNGAVKHRGIVQIPIGNQALAQAAQVHMDIVDRQSCPK